MDAALQAAARHDLVKEFAIGCTKFADVARIWMTGTMPDDEATTRMVENFAGLCAVWD